MLNFLIWATVAAASAPPAYFEPLQALVGHCWTAQLGKPGLTDTQCFDALYGGALIHNTHVVKGGKTPYEGTTIFSYDGKNQRLRYHYFTSTGAVSEGHASVGESGLVWVEVHVGTDGKRTELRSSFEQISEREYRVSTQSDNDEAPVGVRLYQRVEKP